MSKLVRKFLGPEAEDLVEHLPSNILNCVRKTANTVSVVLLLAYTGLPYMTYTTSIKKESISDPDKRLKRGNEKYVHSDKETTLFLNILGGYASDAERKTFMIEKGYNGGTLPSLDTIYKNQARRHALYETMKQFHCPNIRLVGKNGYFIHNSKMHGAYMDHFNHTYYLYRILLEQIDSPTRGARDFLEDRGSIDRFQYKMIGDMLSEITHAASMEENKGRYIDAFIQDALPQIARKEFPYWIKEQTVSYDTLVAYRNFASGTERDTLSVDHCLEKNSFPKTDTFPDKNYIPLLGGYSLYTGRYEDGYNNPKGFEGHIHEIDQKYIEEAYLRNYKQYMDTTNQDELYEYALICLGYFFRSKHIFAEQEGLDILWKMIRHTDSKMAKIALIDYYQNKIFNIGMAGGLKKQFKIGKETNTAKKKQATYHVSTCLETLFCFTDAEKSNPLLKIECIEKKVTK